LLEQPLGPAPRLSAPFAPPEAGEPPAGVEPELRGLLAQVSELRGLPAPPRLQLLALPADELARVALAQTARAWPEPARRTQALLLVRLGLLPPGSELLALLQPALQSGLDAFYARVDGVPTLYLRSTLAGRARREALAHELVHALQDHRHALLQRLADPTQSADRRSALHALAEADALALVEQLGLASETSRPPVALPAVLLRSLAAPYHDGRAAVAEALRAGGFGDVDALLQRPPSSTHALLHATAGAPVPSLPELPAPGPLWQQVHTDVLGEQGLRVVLEEDSGAAAALAAAWRADRLSLFESAEGQQALAWQLELAEQRAAAHVEGLLRRGPQRPNFGTKSETALPGAKWTCGAHSDAGVVATARREQHVVFASLTPGSQIAPPDAQCATLQAWIGHAALAVRPGSDGPHRSLDTPPDSRSETLQ
jgi:hypothetical protein